jgi:hypothetical protein
MFFCKFQCGFDGFTVVFVFLFAYSKLDVLPKSDLEVFQGIISNAQYNKE